MTGNKKQENLYWGLSDDLNRRTIAGLQDPTELVVGSTRVRPKSDGILDILRASEDPVPAHQIAQDMGLNLGSLRTNISRLRKSGVKIETSTRGYRLIDDER